MSTLDDLRREIDGIDEALHDLLMRRVEIGKQVAEAKGGDRGPYFRPGREAQIIRRLVARNESFLNVPTLIRFWREILSANLNMQTHVHAAVFMAEGAERVYDLARDHCGISASIECMDGAGKVLDAVSSGAATLGVLPGVAMKAARWWPLLLSDRAEGMAPRIIARLPFCETGPEAGINGFAGDAFIVAAQEPEESGEDRTLFAVETGHAVDGEILDEADGFRLVEQAGFLEAPEGLERHMGGREGEVPYYRIGAYAAPVHAG
ncbi:chorismate mutase [Nisaea acidiphila]|uniref:chorismate mutase n=1 Tax=Nisaea acidiphila TaxID=1862145 RepID=A0A9J7ALX6_9PROT|nr:chorismate mutase [Nisaea acidiphila]UUX48158.1 chorismate mutase [Nisaea acidiphila]